MSKPFIETANWFDGRRREGPADSETEKEPQIPGVLVSPSTDGAANYPAPSFNPDTGLFYINATESWSLYYLTERTSNAVGWGKRHSSITLACSISALRALDYRTGEVKWEHRYPGLGFGSSTYPGMLSTAGKLLFTGDAVRQLHCLRSGERQGALAHQPWRRHLQHADHATCSTAGQYVVVASGDTLYAFSIYNIGKDKASASTEGKSASSAEG